MANETFFDSADERSIIKKEIVTKYFSAWAQIMKNRVEKMGYIDLYCGPGMYKNGTESTPLEIVRKVIADDVLREKVIFIFNDETEEFITQLRSNIEAIEGYDKLKNKPSFSSEEIDGDDGITDYFNNTSIIPCFSFLDPFGYKGITKELIASLIKDWGCDAVFLLNYNRINAAINNPIVEPRVTALFGEENLHSLKEDIRDLGPQDREMTVIDKLVSAIKKIGGEYILPFKFNSRKQERTSHYLIFVTKHLRGYEIMKDIMAGYSKDPQTGVATFEYIPATRRQLHLFPYTQTLGDLKRLLLSEFAGESMTVQKIYSRHHIGTPFVKSNYKKVLIELEKDGIIRARPSMARRKRNTMADHVLITFS